MPMSRARAKSVRESPPSRASADTLRRLEDEHFADLRRKVAAETRQRNHDDVVHVPGGPFIAGASQEHIDRVHQQVGSFQMNDQDNRLRVVELPPFTIDRTAVTNRRYADFLAAADGTERFYLEVRGYLACLHPIGRVSPRLSRYCWNAVGGRAGRGRRRVLEGSAARR